MDKKQLVILVVSTLIFPLVIGLILLFIQKETKSIEYSEVQTRIISEIPHDKCDSYTYISDLRINNSGNTPIIPSDYYEDIILKINSQSRLIEASIYNKDPENISVGIAIQNNDIHLSKELLNPGDNYGLSFITCGEEPKFHFQTRISKLSEITEKLSSEFSDKNIFLCFHLLILIVICIQILKSMLSKTNGIDRAFIIGCIGLLFWTKINTLVYLSISTDATFGFYLFVKYYLIAEIGGLGTYYYLLNMISNKKISPEVK